MSKKEKKESAADGLKALVKKNKSDNLRFMKRADELFFNIFEAIRKHEKILQEVTEINRNVDQTLCHVLLAIRQNEYLQAWYPKKGKTKNPDACGNAARRFNPEEEEKEAAGL